MGQAADQAVEQVKSALVTIRNTLIGFTVATAAGAAGLLAMVKSAANVGDEINKTAPLLGFSAEEFQKYRYAAKLAGVENEAFATSTQLLLRNLAEARNGNKETLKSFARAGLDPAALTGMSTDQILRRLSDGLAAIPDQATRVSVSMDLLGRSGARMGAFLAKGTEEMDAIMGDVETFGMFSAESAQQAEDFNDALERVFFFFGGIKNAAQGLFPVLTNILNEFRGWLTAHREMINAGLKRGIEILTGVIQRTWEVIKRVVRSIETVIRLLGGYRNTLRLIGIAALAIFIPLIGPLFMLIKGLGFLLVPFIRLHTLITLVTIALSALMPLWSLFVGIASALAATKVVGWLIGLAGGYRALAAAILVPTLAFVAQAAALAAIILFFEDLTVWMLGGKSVIGEWLGAWDAIPDRIRAVWQKIKDVFKEGGAFIRAVLSGDWKEAARLFVDLSKPVTDAALATGQALAAGAKNLASGGRTTSAQGSASPAFQAAAGGWGGMAPAYAFAGAAGNGRPLSGGPGAGNFAQSFRLGDVLDKRGNYREGGGASGAGTVVRQSNKIDLNLKLADGTTGEQAKEIAKIVRDTLDQQIDHSLQQSIAPGD